MILYLFAALEMFTSPYYSPLQNPSCIRAANNPGTPLAPGTNIKNRWTNRTETFSNDIEKDQKAVTSLIILLIYRLWRENILAKDLSFSKDFFFRVCNICMQHVISVYNSFSSDDKMSLKHLHFLPHFQQSVGKCFSGMQRHL